MAIDTESDRQTEAARTARASALVLALAGLAVVAFWVLPIAASLWLDETGTVWMIDGTFADAVRRPLEFQGQSPLYYLLMWVVARAGDSEVLLRLPSILGGLLALWLVSRLGRRLFDAETGILAAFFLALSGEMIFAAGDARSYALAVAALVGSTLLLVRWLDERRALDAVGYAVVAALTIYLHYLFALTFVAHAVYLGMRARGSRARAAAPLGLAALLLVPAVPHVAALLGRRGLLSVAGDVSYERLLSVLAPPTLVGGAVVGLLVARAFTPLSLEPRRARAGTAVLLGTWLVVPPTAMLLVSRFTSTELTFARYFLSAAPAFALLAAWGLRAVGPARARRIVVVPLVLVALLVSSVRWQTRHGNEDWRGAARALHALVTDPGTPVLVDTGFIESSNIDWLTEPERSSYLLAPAAAYPMPGRVMPTPFILTDDAVAHLEDLLARDLLRRDCIVFVERRFGRADGPFRPWLRGRLAGLDYATRDAGRFGIIVVTVFQRGPLATC